MDRLKSYKNKTFVQNMITIGMVVVCYAVIQALIATGNINSLMKGILVPICTYVILAVSLNLTVGILGELSLGHAGFMCVGAFPVPSSRTLWQMPFRIPWCVSYSLSSSAQRLPHCSDSSSASRFSA